MEADDNSPEWGTCQQEGCTNAAAPYWLPDSAYPDDPDGLYCAEHANSAGWCWGCGNFWGGIEFFDFSRTGLCENCEPQFLRDCGEDCHPWYEEDVDWHGD